MTTFFNKTIGTSAHWRLNVLNETPRNRLIDRNAPNRIVSLFQDTLKIQYTCRRLPLVLNEPKNRITTTVESITRDVVRVAKGARIIQHLQVYD